MVSHSHASRRDQVVRRARELVLAEPVQFALAGQRLDSKYSEETVRVDDPDPVRPGEKLAVEMTPEMLLFMRHGAALDCLRHPDQHRYDNHLDFEHNTDADERRMIARMAVLVYLAAIDPNKGEVIDETMGQIASIPFKISAYKGGDRQHAFAGSEWVVWTESDWDKPNEPSPGVLRKFQDAIDVAKHGSSEAARRSRVPTGDGRPCDHKGKNRFDECERALRDVGRFVAHFYYCVNHYRHEWPYRHDEQGYQQLEAIIAENRIWWPKWSGVIDRARDAITTIDRPELASAKQRAFDALVCVASQYQEPGWYNDHEEPGDHLFRTARKWQVDPKESDRLEKLVEALNAFDPLRWGCLLYLDAVDEEDREEPRPVISQQQMIQVVIAHEQKVVETESEPAQAEATAAVQSKPMSIDDARKKAEAIARSQGWPVFKGKPSINGMAKRVGCSHHLMSKALDESKTLRYHFDLASRQSVVNSEEDRQREIRILEREQDADDKRIRYGRPCAQDRAESC